MTNKEKVIKGLEKAKMVIERWVPMSEQYNTPAIIDATIELINKQQEKIEKYEADKRWDECPDMMGKW